jgi:amino acid transporter
LRFSASQGLLPPSFARRNQPGVSIRILLIQGIIVTAWMLLLTFGTSSGQTTQKDSGAGNVAFFTTEALTVLTYLSMYVLLFLSYLKLKVKHPSNPRKFSMPAWLGWIISLVGLAATLFAYVIGWFRPSQIPESSYSAYLMILACGFIVIFVIPHIIYHFAKDEWGQKARDLMVNDDFSKSLAEHGVSDEEVNQANLAAAHGGV